MAVIGDFVEQEMGGGEVPQGSCGTERLHSGVKLSTRREKTSESGQDEPGGSRFLRNSIFSMVWDFLFIIYL